MKLSQLLIVGTLMVSSAVPVLATSRDYNRYDRGGSGVKVENSAVIDSSASATSGTGMNVINDCGCGGQVTVRYDRFHRPNNNNSGDNLIDTGAAGSQAFSEVATVNTTDVPMVAPTLRFRERSSGGSLIVDNNARIHSDANAMSGTGMNMINGSGDNTIMTGDASSLADSFVHDVNVTGFGL